MMRIAACQYQFTSEDSDNYAEKLEKQIVTAAHHNADLIVFPEYLGMQIGTAGSETDKDLFASMQPKLQNYIDMFKTFAKIHNVYIQSGTTLITDDHGRYANRAFLFSPDGSFGYQDKLQFTAYEKQSDILTSNMQQTVFSTSLGMIGIAVCYDSEFPEIVRQLVSAGAKLILVPSYTTTYSGYYRVQLSCRARAIENQCYVAMAAMVGPIIHGTKSAEETVGAAGIFGPADADFSADGIVAQGNLNQPEIIFGDLSFDKIDHVRKHGQVHNYVDTNRLTHISNHINILAL